MSLNVLVTGAAGRTGRLVLESLVTDKDNFQAKGMVRSVSRAKESLEAHFETLQPALVEGDITQPASLQEPMKDVDALVILTSATPKMYPPVEGQPPSFYFLENGMPEDVDWNGSKNQIDCAKKAGVQHIVFVGSMGGTDENHALNRIGNGNILRFKRKAELYLIDSGVDYTIINPSGLLNEAPGERKLVVGRNDELFEIYSTRDCGIPRADVARIAVAALTTDNARNKAFDVVGRPKGQGDPTVDVSALFADAGPDL